MALPSAGAPLLAVEYADRGTDEEELQAKIRELSAAGTRLTWVVRLVGPRRVDVYPGEGEPFTVGSGGMLDAEGILSRPMPVDALFDPQRAEAVALENLLRRSGLRTFEQGRAEGVRTAIEALCEVLELPLEPSRLKVSLPELESLLLHLRKHRAWP